MPYVRQRSKQATKRSSLSLLFKLLGHDIRFGFAENKSLFLLAFGIFSMFAFVFYNQTSNVPSVPAPLIISGKLTYIDLAGERASVIDYLLFFFQGIKVYVPSPENPFMLPVFWMAIQVGIALLVAVYPSRDLYGYAPQVILRAQSKWVWWLSKCLWVIATVVAFYAIGFAVALAGGIISGGGISGPNTAIGVFYNKLDVTGLQGADLSFLLLLPFVTTAALSLLQMALSFVIKPVMSFVALMSYHLISWVIFSPFLIADYPMLLRNGLFYPGGLSSGVMVSVCAGIALVIILVGIPLFRRMNIYPK